MSLWKALTGYWSKGGSTGYDKVGIDGSTNALTTITYPHHEIHNGDSFEYVNAIDIAGSTTQTFLLVTPNTTKWGHFTFILNAEAELLISFYEDSTPDADGTPVSTPGINNRNGNSATATGMALYVTPTLGAGSKGTLLRVHHVGSGKSTGGSSQGQLERILKQNSKHWVDIQNLTSSNNYVSVEALWYEHTDEH